MSENYAVSHATLAEDRKIGWVGSPLPGVEQKLSDENEILVKSPGTMLGYYKEAELTRATLDEDGFIHTGDRGELDAKGQLRITGRVKEPRAELDGKLAAVRDEVNRGLDPHERLDRLVIVGDEWTTANGLLTPTLKLKRGALEDRYASTLATALAAREPIVWEA
jgi:long-subunit acyl-CoA synthetase (AMP-forming)